MQQYRAPGEIVARHAGLESLEDGFCMVDGEWRVGYWNAAAERLLRIPRERICGRTLREELPEWLAGEGGAQLQSVCEQNAPRRYLQRRPGGRFLSIHAAPMEGGGLALQFRDVTDEVLRAEQHASLLESIRDGFVAVDRNWTVVYINSLAESILRFPRERAVGASLWKLLPRRTGMVGECLRATMSDGVQRHLREVTPEGRVFRGRSFDLWTFPLPTGGISILFEDVGERVQRERELARLAAEAQEANEAKSRFFAAISHELRTPLNAIVGYTHLLGAETYGTLPAGAQRASQRASLCAEHLSRLVDDVLLLTSTEPALLQVLPAQVELQTFLPTALDPLRLQAEAKGLAFSVRVAPSLPPVETDAQRLRQLLTALVGNAIKYTSRGRVEVVVRPAESGSLAEPGTDVYTLFPAPHVEIVISDTGPGIPPEHRERIFGPFEQLGDPSRSESFVRGTGLGLSIARHLATLLRGSLELASTSEVGSTFRVRLPLSFPTTPS